MAGQVIALAVAAIFVIAGRADASVVYSYTGNSFPFIEAGNQGTAQVTGTATFDTVPQLPAVHIAQTYALSIHREGLPAITISSNQDNIESKVGYFLFGPDGNIVRWGVELVEDFSMGDFPRQIYTGNAPLDSDAVGDGYFFGPLRGEGYNENDPGVWKVAPIPLPEALPLLLSSVLVLVGASLRASAGRA